MSDLLDTTLNLVHPEWEVLDPTPNVHVLFGIFDKKFFQNKLQCVELEWSKRMYSCAGICYQRRNGMGKSCTIRLSEPLLKLRSRKELVETLIHEMIHAYCFILNIREGNGGHGPVFIKIMNGINKIAGTNITVYHTFHDEVNLYKTHWWQCNGVCRTRPPFYGYVKRTSNRAPGPNDRWFAQHQQTCGGVFVKIREPEKKPRGKKTKEEISGSADLRNYFTKKTPATAKPKPVNSTNNIKGGTVANWGGGTVVIKKPPATIPKAVPQPTKPPPLFPTVNVPVESSPKRTGGNNGRIVSLGDLNSPSPEKNNNNKRPSELFTGSGQTLGGSNPNKRSRLLDQFASPPTASTSRGSLGGSVVGSPHLNPQSRLVHQFSSTPKATSSATVIDLSQNDGEDDMFLTINLDEYENKDWQIQKAVDAEFIKKEILDEIKDEGDDDIMLIDNDYDDFYEDTAEDQELITLNDSLLDNNVLNEIFDPNDSLLEDFQQSNVSRNNDLPEVEIISCPVCLKKMKRMYLDDHLDKCASIGMTDEKRDEKPPSPGPSERPSTSAGTSRQSTTKTPDPPVTAATVAISEDEIKLLKESGYTSADIIAITGDEIGNRSQEVVTETIDLVANEAEMCACPVCAKTVKLCDINTHLDVCCNL